VILAHLPSLRGLRPGFSHRHSGSMISALLSSVLLALTATALSTPSTPVLEEATADGRVIVIGFDGADYRTTARMIEEGQLPNLAKLAENGTFAPLYSTNPAESAAGWAALNTGVNPTKNGVPSFVIRDFKSSGDVGVTTGHISIETMPIEDFEPEGFLGLVAGTSRTTLALGAGIGVAIIFFLLLAVLVRTNKWLASALAIALGVLSGVAGWRARSWVPEEVPKVHRNQVQADAFWDHAGQAGVPSLVLDAALAFDRPHHPNTRVLSGLGLPDIRGASNGEWFFYTNDDTVLARAEVDDGSGERVKTPRGSNGTSSGRRYRFKQRSDGVYESLVFGPLDMQHKSEIQREIADIEDQLTRANWRDGEALHDKLEEAQSRLSDIGGRNIDRYRVSLPLEAEVQDDHVRITIAGRAQDLREGEWSDWFHLPFEISPLVRVSAVTRIKVMSLSDPLELYVNSLEIDPEDPPFWQPISQPTGFSAELAQWIDSPFETLGWSCMTNQMKDVALDEQTFLEDIEFTMSWRRKLVNKALTRDDWRLFFGVFSTTDRVQHILYKHYDPGHPQHNAEAAAQEVKFFGETIPLSDAIPAIYRQMDKRVGEIVAELGPNDTLMLCADHGFNSFRHQMDVNSWLIDRGYMTLRADATKADGGSNTMQYVDWERTQAYSLGLGMLWLNLKGREPNGVVDPEEGREILEAIQEEFLALRDDKGAKVGLDAAIVWDLYPSDWQDPDYECADLMLGFAENYRTSWRTVSGKAYLKDGGTGALPGDFFRDNTNPWSGDHASNSPALVTGIFFSSRKVDLPTDGVSVMHIAPTALDRLGVEVPDLLDMAPLVESN
jgi:predicted AlkP superfamily phosphohydrolase/phosphomutase